MEDISQSKLLLLYEETTSLILEYIQSKENLFETTVRSINEIVVDNFNVTCCSLWMHYKDTDTIECVDIYSKNTNRHQKAHNPFPFDKNDPYFFQLLRDKKYFFDYQETTSLQESVCRRYIKQYSIKYKYDIALTYQGRFVAMLCVENTQENDFLTPVFKRFIVMLQKELEIFIDEKFKKEIEEKFQAVEKNEHTGILIYRDKVLYANQAITNMNGFSFEEMQQVNTWDLFAPEYREQFKNIIRRRMKGEQFPKNYFDVKVISKMGKILNVRLSAETIMYEGKYAGISTVTDITDIVEARELLHKLATTDVLTKIYNRRKMHEAIDAEITRYKRYKDSFGFIMFDIDYFKNINDAYGHDIGDEVLVELSDLIKSKIRQSDCFARWGGEEFLIMVRNIEENALFNLAQILRIAVENQTFSSEKIDLTISLGVTIFQENDTKEDALKRVDIALYRAKQEGRNTVILS